ncbi:MAG: nuclear transport factor 2 family protein [Mycetocola sp.]
MIDRDEIRQCLGRYARGVDRLDSDLILSAYHQDATDDHGSFVGSPTEFVKWYLPIARATAVVHHHYLANHFCELIGDVAHTETYYLYAAESAAEPNHRLHGGRYIDRFERREGRWAIAQRVHVAEWSGALTDLPQPPTPPRRAGTSARNRTDSSYWAEITLRNDSV